jgi:hypothetical protein
MLPISEHVAYVLFLKITVFCPSIIYWGRESVNNGRYSSSGSSRNHDLKKLHAQNC